MTTPSPHPSPLKRLDGHTIVRIETPRLMVRGVRPQDLNDLMVVNADDEVTRFLPYAPWRSLSDATQWFARMQALQTAGVAQQLVVEHKAQGRAVGTVLLFKFDAAAARVELGYVMSRELWRQGCTREALSALCAHVFQGLGLRRIEAEVNPANEASCAVLRSLGFQLEGTLRQRWVARSGEPYDTLMFACLRDAWRPGA